MTALWVVGIWFGLAALFLLVCVCRYALSQPCIECRRWQAMVDELEAEIRTADRTIGSLHRNIDVAFDAGIVQGQLLQAEREENGL